MNLFNQVFDASEYIQSLPDLLIHEISKPSRPFDNEKASQRIPLKYKNPDVSKNPFINAYRKYLIY